MHKGLHKKSFFDHWMKGQGLHYYQFNIADYRKDTQHLSPIEHYIYRELMDWYYLDEKLIPKITQLVLRRLRLVSENEPDLLNVLQEYFIETENGWCHGRIEIEIAAYQKRSITAKANGSKGGRPLKPRKTNSVKLANQNQTKEIANQEPVTSNQEPRTNKEQITSPSAKADPTPYSKIIDAYHDHCEGLPRVVELSEARKKSIAARHRQTMERDLDNWVGYFKSVSRSDFLMGRVKDWRASFDFLIKQQSVIGVLEGKYS